MTSRPTPGDEQIVPTKSEIEQRDEKLVQFLSMAGPDSEVRLTTSFSPNMELQIDPEVAMEILAANNWDVAKAWEQLRGPDQAMEPETPERLPGVSICDGDRDSLVAMLVADKPR